MEILYLWIDNYRSIKKQGFNFGGEFIFDFNPETARLTVTENQHYIEDFFGPEVRNLTAIIGGNGSGKSSILDFIKFNVSYDLGNTNSSFILLFKEKEVDEILLYNSTNLKVKVGADKTHLFKRVPKGEFDDDLVSLRFPTAFVYYSPILDLNFSTEGCPVDISMSELVRNHSYQEEYRHNGDLLFQLSRKELESQLRFISEYKDLLPFALPKELHMGPSSLNEREIRLRFDGQNEADIISTLKKIKRFIEKELYDLRGERERVYVELYESLFWHTINYLISANKGQLLEFLKDQAKNPDTKIWERLKWLYINPSLNEVLPSWQEIGTFFTTLRRLEKEEVMYYSFARFNFEFDSQASQTKTIEFWNSYHQLANKVGNFMHFFWEGISSGEQAMLSLYSRFYSARKDIASFTESQNDSRVNVHKMDFYRDDVSIVILIDEGESHFHPQWQKKYLQSLTEYLPKIIGASGIQFIVTSNSPFMISDVPHHNVILLNSEDGNTVVKPNDSLTFAANVHELLAKSFFLDSTIGSLAEHKINQVISRLRDEQPLSKPEETRTRKLIQLIDDSFVRNKLFQMYALKVEESDWEEQMLIEQQRFIEQRLEQLNRNKGNAEN